MTADQREVLQDALKAFEVDREMRDSAVAARRALKHWCKEAHRLGLSDQQLANAFGEYSRARIQQIRTKEGS